MKYTYVFDEDNERFEHKIEGHKEDNWNVDALLAPLILHLLKEVKDQKLGTPMVSQEDVPEELRFDKDPAQWTEVEYQGNEKQWAWIINEMLWAFDFIVNEYEYSEDMDSFKKEADRVQNGTTLFGKYFQNLWT